MIIRRATRLLLASVLAAAALAGCGSPGGGTSSPSPAPFSPGASAASESPGGYPAPLPLTGDIDAVHDPSMVKAPDGTYLLYSTGENLAIRTSTDQTTWTRADSVWADRGAPWTEKYTSLTDRSALWAPDISFHDGTFYLYYSASSFGSRNSAIFLATSATGRAGSWRGRGLVLDTTSSDSYNAIDPNLFVDDSGSWWLTFGSFWSGLKLVRLDPATGKPAVGAELQALATRPRSVDGAIEAPYLVRHDDYYYLFAAFDLCCRGTSSTYRTMVGRSKSVTGPYVDRDGKKMTDGGGTEVLATHGSIVGPGHPAVLRDGNDWVLVYHYYVDDRTPATGRLGLNRLTWVDGWPVAA
jgi:arabinan endo-1,5-alpha-L-arabinosidase